MPATVTIASPVRNRAWILPEFLSAIEGLDYPRDLLRYHFLVNDCVDASPDLLRSWAGSRPAASVEEVHTGVQGWNRYQWPHYDYANLAWLRNRILERFLRSDATHLFSVDSDVIVPPHALHELVAADKPVVAGVIANLPGLSVEESPAHNFLFRCGDLYRHERTVPEGVFEVDLTGAVVLIRRDVVEAGVRYEGRRSGEDVGFCEQAKAKGFRLWCHGGVRCDHRMNDPAQPTPSERIPAIISAVRQGGMPLGAGVPQWRRLRGSDPGSGGGVTSPPAVIQAADRLRSTGRCRSSSRIGVPHHPDTSGFIWWARR